MIVPLNGYSASNFVGAAYGCTSSRQSLPPTWMSAIHKRRSAREGSIYTTTDASGPPIVSKPGQDGAGTILGGFLEASNVDPVKEARALAKELEKYDPELAAKPRWLVLNKLDMVPTEERDARLKDFVKRFKWKGPVFQISALTREGCEPLIHAIYQHVAAAQRAEEPEEVDPRFAAEGGIDG